MNLWRSSVLVKLTLFFFTVMLLYNPAYAEQVSFDIPPDVSVHQDQIPITYVNESEVGQLIWELQRKGYIVREGTLAQLEQLTQANDTQQVLDERADVKDKNNKEIECEKEKSPNKTKSDQQVENKEGGDKRELANEKKCNQDKTKLESEQQDQNKSGSPEPVTGSEPSESAVPPQQPTPTAQPSIYVNADLSYGTQGSSSDAAKVFFLLLGFVVVAAFVVYAGKYVADIVRNEDYKMWWEFIFNSSFMSTESRQHGNFYGAKLATGFVSSDLIQLALVGEVGNADINLVLNENSNPQVLNFSAPYWMLGGAARLHLTTKLVNASYLYLEFLGGTTNNSATGTISTARLGASFGIGDNLRLGASYGAQYIGLDEDQGYTNDNDNYWFTLGLEIGVRF